MTEAQAGIVVFLAISVITAAVVHGLDRNFLRAWGVSTLVATVAFQVAASLHAGHSDPFLPIAIIVGGAATAAISATMGGLVFGIRTFLGRSGSPSNSRSDAP